MARSQTWIDFLSGREGFPDKRGPDKRGFTVVGECVCGGEGRR
jgi:hypothetical protein